MDCALADDQPEEEDNYLRHLVTIADTYALHEEREWHLLLHYEPYLFLPGRRSLIDSPGFFLGKNGKTDPKEELLATLRSLFSSPGKNRPDQHAQCRFVARYRFLADRLEIDQGKIPKVFCKEYERFREKLSSNRLTLVFSSAYLGMPATMFGHTLLRFDRLEGAEHPPLLQTAISYAASVEQGASRSFLYALKGLFGGYHGAYSAQPYYQKVLEYSDIESRDIWEYRLNLNPKEIERIIEHLWEIAPERARYYFFDENCAYVLLTLLEIARPSLHLTKHFRAWVLPSDTVSWVAKQEELVDEVIYRPSIESTLRAQNRGLGSKERKLAIALARRKISLHEAHERAADFPERKQSLIYDVAWSLLSYDRALVRDNSEPTQKYLHELSLERSHLPRIPDTVTPRPPHPDDGHRPARVDISYGRWRSVNYWEWRIRPVFHDLVDRELGYERGAEIEGFSLRLRKPNGLSLQLQEFTLFGLKSFSGINAVIQPISWKVNLGLLRLNQGAASNSVAFRLNGGAGGTWNILPNAYITLLVEGTADLHHAFKDYFETGIGPSALFVFDIDQRSRVLLQARSQRYVMGLSSFTDHRNAYWLHDGALTYRFAPARNLAFQFRWALQKSDQRNFKNDVSISLSWYFY